MRRRAAPAPAVETTWQCPLSKFGDAADRLQRGDRIGRGWGRRGIPRIVGAARGQPISNVEQHLEQQLLSLVRRVEIDHAALVPARAGPLVGFAVYGFEIVEDSLPGTGRHAEKIRPL